MAKKVFEIWWTDLGRMMLPVDPQSDRLIQAYPEATLVHVFTAESSFEAFQKNYDFNDFGVWDPGPEGRNDLFTDEEVAEQQRYMATRSLPNGQITPPATAG